MPVLFYLPDGQYFLAYTANVVNGLVAEGQIFMNDSKGPMVSGVDMFHPVIAEQLNSLLTAVYLDTWWLHGGHGEVHCGSNTKRQPVQGTNWWNAWQGQ